MHAYFEENHKWLFIIPASSIIGLIVVFYMLWKLSYSIFKEVTCIEKNNGTFKVDQVFILHIIGLYLIMVALIGLAQAGISLFFIYFYLANEYGSAYRPEMTSQTIFKLMSNSLKLIIGITLLIRPNGWTKLLNRFRG